MGQRFANLLNLDIEGQTLAGERMVEVDVDRFLVGGHNGQRNRAAGAAGVKRHAGGDLDVGRKAVPGDCLKQFLVTKPRGDPSAERSNSSPDSRVSR
jgi:hypothetical protein